MADYVHIPAGRGGDNHSFTLPPGTEILDILSTSGFSVIGEVSKDGKIFDPETYLTHDNIFPIFDQRGISRLFVFSPFVGHINVNIPGQSIKPLPVIAHEQAAEYQQQALERAAERRWEARQKYAGLAINFSEAALQQHRRTKIAIGVATLCADKDRSEIVLSQNGITICRLARETAATLADRYPEAALIRTAVNKAGKIVWVGYDATHGGKGENEILKAALALD